MLAQQLTATHTRPRLQLIMSDNERRDPTTDLAPPPTVPPGADDAAADAHMTMIPKAGATPQLDENGLVPEPSSMPELLYNQLMRVHHSQTQRDDDLLNPSGKFAALVRGLVDAGADKVALKLEPRFAGIERELATAREDAAKAMRISSEALNRVVALEALLAQNKTP